MIPTKTDGPEDRGKMIELAAFFLIVGGSFLTCYLAADILAPLMISAFLAILLRPSVRFLNESLSFPISLACFLAVLYALIIVALVVALAGYQLGNLMENWPVMSDNLERHVTSVQRWIRRITGWSYSAQYRYLKDSFAGQAQELVLYFSSLANGVLYLILIPLYTFFILLYRSLILTFLVKIAPNNHIPGMEKILVGIQGIIKNYIRGILLQAVFVSLMMIAGYYAIGLKYAIFLGIMTGLLNVIPYVGILIAGLFSSLIALSLAQDPTIVWWVIGINALVQFLDNNILVPKIVGSKVSINALASILGVIIGGALAGIAGMFLAIPILAILKVVFDHVPGWEAYGYVLGDDNPRFFNWSKIRLMYENKRRQQEKR